MEIHPTTVLIGGALIVAFMSASPRAKAWDDPKRDPRVHEAQAARQEARQGKLKDPVDAAQQERNRYARCELHANGEDRELCIRRMNGEGTVTGSYEGGGIYRELRVTVPAPTE
jgi:hypothetical protein